MTERKTEKKQENSKIKTFDIQFDLKEVKENVLNSKNTHIKPSKEEIINLAFQAHSLGNIGEAEKYYKYFLSQEFIDPIVLSNLGVIQHQKGKIKLAINLFKRSINLFPHSPEAYSNLGNILRDDGNLKEAESLLRKAIQLNPKFHDAYLNLGNILRDLRNNLEAEKCIRKVIELNPKLAKSHTTLGNILLDLGKIEEAELSIRNAIKLDPNEANAYFSLFRQYEQRNKLEELKDSLNEFDNIKFIKNELFLFNARFNFRKKQYKVAKTIIDKISHTWVETSITRNQLIYWSYKAFIEDKNKNYDLAYSYFKKSQMDPVYKNFSKDIFINTILSYKNSINSQEKLTYKIDKTSENYKVSFLLGFPRSGTTLLDTILRSHPKIDVMEEKSFLESIEHIILTKYNLNLDEIFRLSSDQISYLREIYLQLIKKYKKSDDNYIVDKLPLNTTRLPLIYLLFPKAKIIFAHRNPYDTILSCFQQSFTPNYAMANFVTLKSSAYLYNEVMAAWDKYKNTLPINFISSRYEDLINNFDSNVSNILNFLDLDWDENVRNYINVALKRDKINTPSSSQVVQPLYKSSIGKWKNYEKYFKDCRSYIDRWVAYFDY